MNHLQTTYNANSFGKQTNKLFEGIFTSSNYLISKVNLFSKIYFPLPLCIYYTKESGYYGDLPLEKMHLQRFCLNSHLSKRNQICKNLVG